MRRVRRFETVGAQAEIHFEAWGGEPEGPPACAEEEVAEQNMAADSIRHLGRVYSFSARGWGLPVPVMVFPELDMAFQPIGNETTRSTRGG
ncbi:hypothetical protein ACFXGT_30335 [Streptomyces sp. NPDC059352]|uniref:hypothetical protein n=1 Tax=Streptomyces sp. NPDC059352 TaxID=3346810 RepID=UPI003673BDF9